MGEQGSPLLGGAVDKTEQPPCFLCTKDGRLSPRKGASSWCGGTRPHTHKHTEHTYSLTHTQQIQSDTNARTHSDTHTRTHTHTNAPNTLGHTYSLTHTHTLGHTHTHTHKMHQTHTDTHTHSDTHTHTHTHTHTRTHTHTHTHTPSFLPCSAFIHPKWCRPHQSNTRLGGRECFTLSFCRADNPADPLTK